MAPKMLATITALLLGAGVHALEPDLAVDVYVQTPTQELNEYFLGCHSDSGYGHAPRGFSAQLIYDESFEATNLTKGNESVASGWHDVYLPSKSGGGNVTRDTTAPLNGWASRKLTLFKTPATAAAASTGSTVVAAVGVANRGLGNEGLYLEPKKDYEGYLFARGASAAVLTIALEDHTTSPPTTLASANLSYTKVDGSWQMLNFSKLVPTAGTECEGIAFGSDPSVDCGTDVGRPSHVCVKCGGQFAVYLTRGANARALGTGDLSVNVDFVYFQPGSWGRYGDLPVLLSGALLLREMGITAIRQGGSFVASPDDGAYYQWQKWTGPPWNRSQSTGAAWTPMHGGRSLIGGFGPFEMVDLANAMDIEPIIGTTASSTPASLADFVDYCWAPAAGAGATPMGRKRAADGHPAPYRASVFEIGDEQENPLFAAQVAAMEARARALGKGGQLKYLYSGKKNADLVAAALANLTEVLGGAAAVEAQVMVDLHTQAGGGVALAEALWAQQRARNVSGTGAVNGETNAEAHGMARALAEAADLNAFFGAGRAAQARLFARAASFCTERSGHVGGGTAKFDQGLAFFLPNQTWLQPPGFVHQMVAETWQPQAVNVEVTNLYPSRVALVSVTAQRPSCNRRRARRRRRRRRRMRRRRRRAGAAAVDASTEWHEDALVVRITNSDTFNHTAVLNAKLQSSTLWPGGGTTATLRAPDPALGDAVNTPGDPWRVAPEYTGITPMPPKSANSFAVVVPAKSYVVVNIPGAFGPC